MRVVICWGLRVRRLRHGTGKKFSTIGAILLPPLWKNSHPACWVRIKNNVPILWGSGGCSFAHVAGLRSGKHLQGIAAANAGVTSIGTLPGPEFRLLNLNLNAYILNPKP